MKNRLFWALGLVGFALLSISLSSLKLTQAYSHEGDKPASEQAPAQAACDPNVKKELTAEELAASAKFFDQELYAIQKSYETIRIRLRETPPIFKNDSFEVSLPAPGVFFLKFPNQHEVTRTFLRFQEHYENDEYRGKVFTLKEFKDWYRVTHGREHGGKKRFTYFTDWAGFNFPSTNFKPFFEGKFKNFTAREKGLMAYFNGLYSMGIKFYVTASYEREDPAVDMTGKTEAEIAVFKGRIVRATLGTTRHEVAHALYFMDPVYHAEVDAILARANQEVKVGMDALAEYLRKKMYDESVVEDEKHAYLGTNARRFVETGMFKLDEIRPTIWALNLALEAAIVRAEEAEKSKNP